VTLGAREHELERRLRAERPEAPEEFVRMLSPLVDPPRHRTPRAVQKLAVVAAVTALLAASLGFVGAFGEADASFHAFGRGLRHLVDAPAAGTLPAQQRASRARAAVGAAAFYGQYGGRVAICRNWHVRVVPRSQLFWYLMRGAHPASACRPPKR
jgi:hypothetical protein